MWLGTESNRRHEAKSLKTRSDTEGWKVWKSGLFYFGFVTGCYGLSPEVGTFQERFRKKRYGPTVSPDGAVGLALVDQNQKVRALFHSETDGSPRLVLSDKDGKERALFELGRDGDPKVVLYDQYNRVRANISLTKGTPVVALRDETGKTVWGGTGLK